MNLLRRIGLIFVPARPQLRVPQVGDMLWWASKQLGCAVTETHNDGSLIFQGGELVKRASGRVTPRWTVSTVGEQCRWDSRTAMWILGEGAAPRLVRGQVVRPDPVDAQVGSQPGRVL